MKKALRGIIIVITIIFTWSIVVIDRFAMALFTGVELPPLRKKPLKVTESTTDEQIEQSVLEGDKHTVMYSKDYLPKARKRALTTIGLYVTYKLIKWVFS